MSALLPGEIDSDAEMDEGESNTLYGQNSTYPLRSQR